MKTGGKFRNPDLRTRTRVLTDLSARTVPDFSIVPAPGNPMEGTRFRFPGLARSEENNPV